MFSNIRGKTCTAVIDAVIAGETDPKKLSEMCTHWRLKSTQEEIALAVEGNFTEHHMFMIRMIRRSIANIEAEIADLDAEIDRRMAPINDIIERLCGIPSMDRTSVKELIAEIGVDMEVFPTADHLASWAGMSPGNNESAGKKSSHTNHGNKATKAIMSECAWCASRTKNTFFSTRYKRLAARRGKKRAIVALGREILIIVYHMLKDGTGYRELGPDYMDDRRKQAQIKYHKEQLKTLLGEDTPDQKKTA